MGLIERGTVRNGAEDMADALHPEYQALSDDSWPQGGPALLNEYVDVEEYVNSPMASGE